MHPRIDHRSGVPKRFHNRSFRRIETPLKITNTPKHVISGSSSKACKTLNLICYIYNIQNKCTISESCIFKLKDINTESDIRTAEAILD